jgi:hypothetical protein
VLVSSFLAGRFEFSLFDEVHQYFPCWNIIVVNYSIYHSLIWLFNTLAHEKSNPLILRTNDMHQAATAQNAMPRFQPEVQEIKRSLPLRKVDETKSEFERSRQASKTWSMGQD